MSLPFLSFIVPILAWNIPLVSLIFLKRSRVFPILFLCIVHLKRLSYLTLLFSETLHSDVYIFFPFLPSLLLFFFPWLFVKPPQTSTLPSFISCSQGWFWSPHPVECYKPWSIVLQAFCLPNLIPWIHSLSPLYNHMGFDLGHTWVAKWFSLFSSN